MSKNTVKTLTLALPEVPAYAEFLGILHDLDQAIKDLMGKTLSFDDLIRVGLMMKEIDKNCVIFMHTARMYIGESTRAHITHGVSGIRNDTYSWCAAESLVVLKRILADVRALEHWNNQPDVIIHSSKHPGITFHQADIVRHIQRLVVAYAELIRALESPTTALLPDRLALKIALIPDERDFYHILAVAKSEQAKTE